MTFFIFAIILQFKTPEPQQHVLLLPDDQCTDIANCGVNGPLLTGLKISK